MKSKLNWERIYKEKESGSFLRYPNEVFITQFFRHKNNITLNGKALDYGCGSGNNTEFLIGEMGSVFGLDISESSIGITKKRLESHKRYYEKNFATSFKSNFNKFDFILAWQVLYYNTEEGFNKRFKELYNRLNNDGVFILTLPTRDDLKVTLSQKISKNTFVITSRIPQQEGCTIFSPSTIEDFLHLFNTYDLNILDYGIFNNSSYVTNNKASEFYLVCKKK
jgi:SAM-dependent methyltransferase